MNSRKTQNHPDNSGLSTSVESMLKPHDHSLSTISPVCVGGLDVHSVDAEKPGRCVYQYNAEENSWSLLTRMPMFRHHHAAVVVAGKLCILGNYTFYTPAFKVVMGSFTKIKLYYQGLEKKEMLYFLDSIS